MDIFHESMPRYLCKIYLDIDRQICYNSGILGKVSAFCRPRKKGKDMAEKTEAQKRAQKKYMEKFMVARVRMERDRYGTIQAHAESCGESVNGFINRAIDETMQRDGEKNGL